MEPEPLPMLDLSWNVYFLPFSIEALICILAIVILLLMSALISGAEVAYFSLSPNDRQQLADDEGVGKIVMSNLAHPDKLLATILVANNFVNVGIVMLSTYTMTIIVNFNDAPVIGFIFQVILVTFFLLLFGEIVPKVYAAKNSVAVSRLMATPLSILTKVFAPLNKILIHSTSFVNKRVQKQSSNLSVDELSHALELTDDQEISEDKEILEGIVKFGNKNAVEIMRPRVDVASIEINESLNFLLNVITENGYSRIPVYEGSFDNIKGILYIKDLLPYLNEQEFEWQSIIRPPFFVPEMKKIDDLLSDFQKNKVHMAIVVDEYGGSSGIVTLEDVMEEIVGDITDEFDETEIFFHRISENKYLFEGKVLIKDFCKVLKISDETFDKVRGEAESIAGLILEITGDIPKVNEKIEFENYHFTIDKVDNRRIVKIKVEVIA